MSVVYTYIATKSTYERVIPASNVAQVQFNRTVANAFRDLSGGTIKVGELKQFSVPVDLANHLLCDGSEVSQLDFPELFVHLGDTQGAAAAGNFKLPDYIGTITAATSAPSQTVDGGAISSGGTVTEPTEPGQTGGTTGGAVPSGGRLTDELNLGGIIP